jgi:hypothetical protein
MDNIKIKEQRAKGGDWLFVVTIGQDEYQVTLERGYWVELTEQKLTPGQLVINSFMFLLDREPQEDILKEFNLQVIQKYFPEYEQIMKQ